MDDQETAKKNFCILITSFSNMNVRDKNKHVWIMRLFAPRCQNDEPVLKPFHDPQKLDS